MLEQWPTGEAGLQNHSAQSGMGVNETLFAEGDDKVVLGRTGAQHQQIAAQRLALHPIETRTAGR